MNENSASIEQTLRDLDDAMGELGFHQAESVEEVLETSNQVTPVSDLSVDELDMFAQQEQTIAEAVQQRDANFTPVPKKRNGIWFQLKRTGNRTEMMMNTPDGESLPTGYGWDKR